MPQIFSKLTEIRRKTLSAIEDVPDTLIGTCIALVLLTLVALGILMFLGYKVTNP
jgi:hypothetical protein